MTRRSFFILYTALAVLSLSPLLAKATCNGELYFDPAAVAKVKDLNINDLQFDVDIYKNPGPDVVVITVFRQKKEVGSLESWRTRLSGKQLWESSVVHLEKDVKGAGVGTLIHLAMARIVHDLFGEGFMSCEANAHTDDAEKVWTRFEANGFAHRHPGREGWDSHRFILDDSRLIELTGAAYTFFASHLKNHKKFHDLVEHATR
jgi:hypothetical protein